MVFLSVASPTCLTLAGYVASLLLGFVVGFFFEACIGMVGFWFLEVTSFLYVVNTVNFFVSGHMFPLDLLPPLWAGVFKALPFQYLAYFPAAVFLGKVQGDELVQGLLVEAAWVVALVVLARLLYARGLRRYSALWRMSMSVLARYFRLWGAFARFCLANEMAFRGNFLAKVLVEVLWLGILLVFYDTLFATPAASPAGSRTSTCSLWAAITRWKG